MVRLTDHLDMTIAVDWDIKPQKKKKKTYSFTVLTSLLASYCLTYLSQMEFPPHQLDQSIFILRIVGWYFSCSNFHIATCKPTVETLIRHHVLWHLIWVCTVCLCFTKKDAILIMYGLIICLYLTVVSTMCCGTSESSAKGSRNICYLYRQSTH